MKQQRRKMIRPVNPVPILWGIPGAGKSTVARWLRDGRGYESVDTDRATMRGVTTDLQRAWMGVLHGQVTPVAFIRAGASGRRPLVFEYFLWARHRRSNCCGGSGQRGAGPGGSLATER